jgi:hypothetical protein
MTKHLLIHRTQDGLNIRPMSPWRRSLGRIGAEALIPNAGAWRSVINHLGKGNSSSLRNRGDG